MSGSGTSPQKAIGTFTAAIGAVFLAYWSFQKSCTIAEVELGSADEEVLLPDWIGKEVSDDWRYYNSNLLQNPFKNWRTEV